MEEKTQTDSAARMATEGGEKKGCGFVVEWKPLGRLDGMTPIWISNERYDKVAALLLRKTKDEHARQQLLARTAPLEMTQVCKGTCDGGWCEEKEVPPDDEEAVATVCECGYFV